MEKSADLEVYALFCKNADLEDGVLMPGGIVFDIKNSLAGSVDLSAGRMGEENFEKSLQQIAKNQYTRYLDKFIRMDLVKEPDFVRQCTTDKYPVLRGYNYLNDGEFYIIKDTLTSNSRESKNP